MLSKLNRRRSIDVHVIERQQSSLDYLYLQNINKQEEEDRRECNMTFIIISILVTYFICTFPAGIVLQIDPNAKKYPKVRKDQNEWHKDEYLFLGTCPYLHFELA